MRDCRSISKDIHVNEALQNRTYDLMEKSEASMVDFRREPYHLTYAKMLKEKEKQYEQQFTQKA